MIDPSCVEIIAKAFSEHLDCNDGRMCLADYCNCRTLARLAIAATPAPPPPQSGEREVDWNKSDDEIREVATAIHSARFSPDPVRWTFEQADKSDKLYSIKIARAAIAALDAMRVQEKPDV